MRRLSDVSADDNYKITIAETTHSFPPYYFTRFSDEVCVVKPGDYKDSPNAAIRQLVQHDNMFLLPKEESKAKPYSMRVSPVLYRQAANPSQGTRFKPRVVSYHRNPDATSNDLTSFVQDLKRSLRLVVVDELGHYQVVYRGAADFEQLPPMADSSDGTFLITLFQHFKLEAKGIKYQDFLKVGRAYYQKMQYFIREVIDAGLQQDQQYLVSRDFDYVSDLVFKQDKTVYLDLYDFTFQISTFDQRGEPISAPCPANVILRIPFDNNRNSFSHPVLFCNQYFLPFLFSDHDISIKMDNGNQSLETEAFRKSLQEELESKSENADKVPRKLTGKYAALVIGGVTCLVIAVTGGVAAFAGPAIIAAIVTTIGVEVSAAAVTAGMIGGGAVVGSGLSSSIYFIARRALGNREIMTISLSNSRLSMKDLVMVGADELLPQDQYDQDEEIHEDAQAAVSRASRK